MPDPQSVDKAVNETVDKTVDQTLEQAPDLALKDTGLWWLWLSIVTLVLDLLSKFWIIDNVAEFEKIPLLSVLNITHVHNPGAAFSFLSEAGGWQRWFFTIITIGVSGLLLWWMKKAPRQNVLLGSAYSLILGGAMGNLYDRVSYGYVEDFIHFYYQNWHFPAFNLADSAISLGAALLIWDAFKSGREQSAAE